MTEYSKEANVYVYFKKCSKVNPFTLLQKKYFESDRTCGQVW